MDQGVDIIENIVTDCSDCELSHLISTYNIFSIDDFAATPRLETLASLKKAELMLLTTLDTPTGAHKADISVLV